MRLDRIGFYTLSEHRAASASATSPLSRCELILTGRCNFRCPYCRQVGGPDLANEQAVATIRLWGMQGLRAIRFSGGEPTLYSGLAELVREARDAGIERIAVSTNGSNKREVYDDLLEAGVNDFSVSLDACCAEDGDKMAGGVKGAWDRVVENIRYLASRTYVTVGVVLTPDNAASLHEIIGFADGLGVSDIRVIPAAQDSDRMRGVTVAQEILDRHPILAYRVQNIQLGLPVRGLLPTDSHHCGLVLDDMAVMGDSHYPCIIYMREGGRPIGKIGPQARAERARWHAEHDTHNDPICSRNCLDVCVQYNNSHEAYNRGRPA